MKTKTIKTPLGMAEAFGLSCCASDLVPESKLSHRSEAHHGFILKLSHPSGKNHRFAKKPSLSDSKTKNVQPEQYGRNNIPCFLVSVASGVFASVGVFSCEATGGDVVACAGACSQAQSHDIGTQARRAKDISRGVFEVFVHTPRLKYNILIYGRKEIQESNSDFCAALC